MWGSGVSNTTDTVPAHRDSTEPVDVGGGPTRERRYGLGREGDTGPIGVGGPVATQRRQLRCGRQQGGPVLQRFDPARGDRPWCTPSNPPATAAIEHCEHQALDECGVEQFGVGLSPHGFIRSATSTTRAPGAVALGHRVARRMADRSHHRCGFSGRPASPPWLDRSASSSRSPSSGKRGLDSREP